MLDHFLTIQKYVRLAADFTINTVEIPVSQMVPAQLSVYINCVSAVVIHFQFFYTILNKKNKSHLVRPGKLESVQIISLPMSWQFIRTRAGN